MKSYRHRLLSTTYLSLAIGSGVMLLGPAGPCGLTGARGGLGIGSVAHAACAPCNPCAAVANPCNPCAALIQPAGGPCSITGLKIINGGGRAEVQAAHIRPVSDQGPDSVRNGLALSGTVHWMFDRGLISIGDPLDYPILLSSHELPDNVRRLFNPDMLLRKPADQRFWPAPAYTEFHRKEVFKG
jgi:hypothetical protein